LAEIDPLDVIFIEVAFKVKEKKKEERRKKKELQKEADS